MGRPSMEGVRRRQLIEATLRAIHEEGMQRTTLSRIGKRAGISPGLVAHYFEDKAGLMEATMRHLGRELGRAVSRRQAAATTPRERVLAVVAGNFAPDQFAPEGVSAWLSFWATVNHDPGLARIQRVISARLVSNLRHALRPLVPAERADFIARGLSTLIDGLWLRCALAEAGVDRETALALARDYLDIQLERSSPAS